MDFFEQVKSTVVNFKLDFCCWIAPVRIGLLVVGYLNIVIAFVSLVATSNESFLPTIVRVQTAISEDYIAKSLPILAYSIELGFSFLLLCAVYRKDLVLLRVYMKYCIAAIVMSFLVYSIVIAALDALLQVVLILSMAYQFYVIILVRSYIVELKHEKRQYELPTIVMKTIHEKDLEKNGDISEKDLKHSEPHTVEEKGQHPTSDVESAENDPVNGPEPGPSNDAKKPPQLVLIKEVKLDTVNEHPKE